MTSRSRDRDVIEGPSLNASLGTEAAACTAESRGPSEVGVNLFYLCIIVYLYGDLAIYATAVPLSLVQVTCFTGNESCGTQAGERNDTDPCWGNIRRIDAYRIYLARLVELAECKPCKAIPPLQLGSFSLDSLHMCLRIVQWSSHLAVESHTELALMQAVFTLFLGPFTFFNVQKTKYLQILTSLMRWIGEAPCTSSILRSFPLVAPQEAFIIMIVLALIRIGEGKGEGKPPMADVSGIRNLFGVCVYSFMCQHSLPSLITPVSRKTHLTGLVLLDYILVLSFYSLLCFTAIFCFSSGSLMDMYTLNFSGCSSPFVPTVIGYFLGLFPVFTISTNFPIIAVTLRNNWRTLFHREGGTYPWLVDRVVFPLITLVPPIIVAFCTNHLEILVSVTGAYAGNGIQYVIPAFLVFCSRNDSALVYGPDSSNKHRSPFKQIGWVWFVLLWAFSCFIYVTANIILTDVNL
ncbi:unnamed protein product [Ranitomeya imitator]|uniref:Transmembrane protein 104 n=1 Tax=Ranitomeya imitator TaxID=111125 RepID=A0ABN9LJX9_9NEOB|nr:unnamed protein product [Ranitomeya imitator]